MCLVDMLAVPGDSWRGGYALEYSLMHVYVQNI